jgi:hypothetical protein
MTDLLGRAVVCGMDLLVLGCAAAPHRYRWQAPVPIASGDWQACHARADGMAQRRYDRYAETIEAAGPFGGPFGGVTFARRAWEEREDAHEWEMRKCLGARGYELRPPGAPAER